MEMEVDNNTTISAPLAPPTVAPAPDSAALVPMSTSDSDSSSEYRLNRMESLLQQMITKQVEWFPQIKKSIEERNLNDRLPDLLLSTRTCPMYIDLKSDVERIIASTIIMYGFNPSKGSVFTVFYEFPEKNFRRVAIHIKALESVIETLYGSFWTGNPKLPMTQLRSRYDYLFDEARSNIPDDITSWNSILTLEIPKNTVNLKKQWRSMTFYRYLQLMFTVFQSQTFYDCYQKLDFTFRSRSRPLSSSYAKGKGIVEDEDEDSEDEESDSEDQEDEDEDKEKEKEEDEVLHSDFVPNLFIEDQSYKLVQLSQHPIWQRTSVASSATTTVSAGTKRKRAPSKRTAPSVVLSEYSHLKIGTTLGSDFYLNPSIDWEFLIHAISDLKVFQILWNIWHITTKDLIYRHQEKNEFQTGPLLKIRNDMWIVLQRLNFHYQEFNEQKMFNFHPFANLFCKLHDILPFFMSLYFFPSASGASASGASASGASASSLFTPSEKEYLHNITKNKTEFEPKKFEFRNDQVLNLFIRSWQRIFGTPKGPTISSPFKILRPGTFEVTAGFQVVMKQRPSSLSLAASASAPALVPAPAPDSELEEESVDSNSEHEMIETTTTATTTPIAPVVLSSSSSSSSQQHQGGIILRPCGTCGSAANFPTPTRKRMNSNTSTASPSPYYSSE
jgi:hypothetical protein